MLARAVAVGVVEDAKGRHNTCMQLYYITNNEAGITHNIRTHECMQLYYITNNYKDTCMHANCITLQLCTLINTLIVLT